MKPLSLFIFVIIFLTSCNKENTISDPEITGSTENRTSCSCSDFNWQVTSVNTIQGCQYTVSLASPLPPDGCLCSNNIQMNIHHPNGQVTSYYNGENGCFPERFSFYTPYTSMQLEFIINGKPCFILPYTCGG